MNFDFDELVARQAGVITAGQAVAAGLPRRTFNRRARSWTPLHPGTFLVAGHLPSHETRMWGALLWAGPDALLGGRTAAWWLGLPAPPQEVPETIVPLCRRPRPRPGVRLRRQDVPRPDRVVNRGADTIGTPLATLQAAAALPDGGQFLDRCLQKHVRFPAVYRCYCRHVGRRGSAEWRRLLVASADRADSVAERLPVRLLRRAGMVGWSVGVPFGPWTIDLAFPAALVAIEVDGWAWHVDPERFRNDRRKGNALVAAGWTLLRFTWHDLDGRPDEVLAEIRAELLKAAA